MTGDPPIRLRSQTAAGIGVRLIGVEGRFATSLRRRQLLYPNPVAEKELGATTRGWETILKIGELLETR